MHPIYINSRSKELNFESFFNEFILICNEHKEKGKAMAFAFIIYDFKNPQISKILRDSDYWLSLNEISGKYLTVFSFHHKPTIRYRKQNYASSFNLETSVDSCITSVNDFDNPSKKTSILLDKYFEDNIKINYPAVLFFQTNEEKVIDYVIIQLDEQEIEKAFLELKVYISEAVKALELIKEEYKNNIQQIFNNLKENVKSKRTKIVVNNGLKKILSITEFVSTIIGISPKAN